MKVVEKFISINGEGRRAGELAVFIRFKGCNLNCSYCDTKWANEPACDYEELSPDKICEYVSETGIKNVTLTGGEPLLQKDIRSLVEKLLNKSDIRVEIETNGAVDIAPLANALILINFSTTFILVSFLYCLFEQPQLHIVLLQMNLNFYHTHTLIPGCSLP